MKKVPVLPAEAEPPAGVVLDDPAGVSVAGDVTAVELEALRVAADLRVLEGERVAAELELASVPVAVPVWEGVEVGVGDQVLFCVDRLFCDSLPVRDPNVVPGDVAVAFVSGFEPDGTVCLRVLTNSWSIGWVRGVGQSRDPGLGSAPQGRFWVRSP